MLQINSLVKAKEININGKVIHVPKMSLFHYNIVKDEKDITKITTKIASSVQKGLSKAERDIVLLHLLEHNGKLQQSVVKNGKTYNLDDVVIIQKLRFVYGDYEFKFKTPVVEDSFVVAEDILNNCLISTKYKGETIPNIDFKTMPAFVYKWLDLIVTTIGIQDGNEMIKGVDNITELFDG